MVEFRTFLISVLGISCSLAGANDLLLKFYLYRVSDWTSSEGETKFKDAIVKSLTSFCLDKTRFTKCGFNSSHGFNFTSSQVQISDGYPMDSGSRYMTLKFNVTYSLGNTSHSLAHSVLKEVVLMHKRNIELALGSHIEEIDSVFYPVPVKLLQNQVIIPIFTIATFILLIVAFAVRNKSRKAYLAELVREQTVLKKGVKRQSMAVQNKVGNSVNSSDQENLKPSWSSKSSVNKLTGSSKSAAVDSNAEYNNIAYDKSMSEQEVRQRKRDETDFPQVGLVPDAKQVSPEHNSDNVIEVLPENSDELIRKKDKKHKKRKHRHNTNSKDSEGQRLMEKSFNHPLEPVPVSSDTDNNDHRRLKDDSIASLEVA